MTRGRKVLQTFQAVKRRVGSHANHLDCRIPALEIAAGTHDGPGGAQRRDEMRDAAFGAGPDFGSRRLVVCRGIGWIAVLVGVPEMIRLTRREGARGIGGTIG